MKLFISVRITVRVTSPDTRDFRSSLSSVGWRIASTSVPRFSQPSSPCKFSFIFHIQMKKILPAVFAAPISDFISVCDLWERDREFAGDNHAGSDLTNRPPAITCDCMLITLMQESHLDKYPWTWQGHDLTQISWHGRRYKLIRTQHKSTK